MSERFPLPIPYGWFPVGRLDELPDQPVSRLRVVKFELMTVVTLITTNRPVESDEIEVRFTLYHDEGDTVAAKIGNAFGAEVERQFDQDIPIWEAKRYQPSPALAPSEKPITEFRRWASQFYSGAPS